jgi:prepilin-type N-terminal cleavage/methylation domain-containing protein
MRDRTVPPSPDASRAARRRHACAGRVQSGFSLVELAIAIFIIALLLGGMLAPLQSRVERRKYDDTRRILDQAREALLGYVATYGYFPCPADYAGVSGGAQAAHTVATGVCLSTNPGSVNAGGTGGVYIGYLPAVTLGVTPTDAQGYAVDAWGLSQNRIRYAVSYTTVNGITNPFTRSDGMRSAGISNILNANLLSVCNTSTGSSAAACADAAATLTSRAVAVIWSLGPNAATGNSPDQLENSEALAFADRVFIMRTPSSIIDSEFDHVVTWISPFVLFNRMIVAGKLP